MHDSADRDPPPRCPPGAREKVIQEIIQWIQEENSSFDIIWVNGRASIGKSALMQTIAEIDGIYFGGCFFFRRAVAGCNVKDHLFSTIAYQLAMNVPGMLEYVDRAMTRDFSLTKKSAAGHLKRLIIEPIRHLPIPPRPIIIIIDGLDECEDFNAQHDILTLVAQVTTDPSVTIRFIISSRPEHQICDMFNKEPLVSRTRSLLLEDEPQYNTEAGIERYSQAKLSENHRGSSSTGVKQNYGFLMSTTVDDLSYTPSAEERSRDAAQFVATGRKSWKTLRGGGEAVWPPHL